MSLTFSHTESLLSCTFISVGVRYTICSADKTVDIVDGHINCIFGKHAKHLMGDAFQN